MGDATNTNITKAVNELLNDPNYKSLRKDLNKADGDVTQFEKERGDKVTPDDQKKSMELVTNALNKGKVLDDYVDKKLGDNGLTDLQKINAEKILNQLENKLNPQAQTKDVKLETKSQTYIDQGAEQSTAPKASVPASQLPIPQAAAKSAPTPGH